MKSNQYKFSKWLTKALFLLFAITVNGQTVNGNTELESDAAKAMDTMLQKIPAMESYKSKSYAYAVFPRITKAAATVGIALGNGVVFKDDVVVGTVRLRQANIGYQFGGQQYIEVIFFEDERIFDKFRNGKLKLDAQASVAALKKGASFDVAYQHGVAIFTATKGGLMYEASVGGQSFKYNSK